MTQDDQSKINALTACIRAIDEFQLHTASVFDPDQRSHVAQFIMRERLINFPFYVPVCDAVIIRDKVNDLIKKELAAYRSQCVCDITNTLSQC